MDELKIRAKKIWWDDDDRISGWLYSNGYYFDGMNCWFPLRGEVDEDGFYPVDGIEWVIVEPTTICRFTGRKDVKGVDIYEGDTVWGKFVDRELPGFEEVEFTAVVRWFPVDAKFALVLENDLAIIDFVYASAQLIEVIGSIY